MKKMGVDGLASSNDLENSTDRLSTYLAPSFSSIKALKYKITGIVKFIRVQSTVFRTG
jgi:hypothetical protein